VVSDPGTPPGSVLDALASLVRALPGDRLGSSPGNSLKASKIMKMASLGAFSIFPEEASSCSPMA